MLLAAVLMGPAHAEESQAPAITAPVAAKPMITSLTAAGDRIFITDSTGKQWCYKRSPWTLLWTKTGDTVVRLLDAPTPPSETIWAMESLVAAEALRRGVDPAILAKLTDGAHPSPTDHELSKNAIKRTIAKPETTPDTRPPALWEKPAAKVAAVDQRPWQERYTDGMRIGKTGAKLGRTGLISGGVGVGFFVAGLLTARGYEDLTDGPLQIVGYGFMGAGVLSASVGANMAASGTTKAHRALADAGLRKPKSALCTAAWVGAIPIPTPAYAVTLPLSFAISGAKRKLDQKVYDKAKKAPSGILRVSPTIGPDGAGIRIAGTL